jgi:hypothetical protein
LERPFPSLECNFISVITIVTHSCCIFVISLATYLSFLQLLSPGHPSKSQAPFSSPQHLHLLMTCQSQLQSPRFSVMISLARSFTTFTVQALEPVLACKKHVTLIVSCMVFIVLLLLLLQQTVITWSGVATRIFIRSNISFKSLATVTGVVDTRFN